MDNGLVQDSEKSVITKNDLVLILIVVDNGLVLSNQTPRVTVTLVLILIVVDNGLVLLFIYLMFGYYGSLNPYCSGQWSRTPFAYLLLFMPH